MDVGDNWMVLGLDLQVLQGALLHLYKVKPEFQQIEGTVLGVAFRLELTAPVIEARPPCGTVPYRIGIHLVGDLYIAGGTDPARFDAWVRLDPAVVTDAAGMPFGSLTYGAVESVVPEGAEGELEKVFQPGGSVGDALAALTLDLFTPLLDAVTRVLHPPADPDPDVPVPIDPAEFAVAFEVGAPASMRRPLYDVDDDDEAFLDIDWAFMTAPALVASVALAGTTPGMPGGLSMVKPGAGLTLLTAKPMFDANLALEAGRKVGVEGDDGTTIDRLALIGVDGGIEVHGRAHKTGGSVTFDGVVVSRYQGGTAGRMRMKPALHTDVDLDWWVPYVGVGLFLTFLPLGLFFVGLVTTGMDAAPDTVSLSVRRALGDALQDAADKIAAGFGVDAFPSRAFLSDVWIVDGHLAVAVTAFLGVTSATVGEVTYDVAPVSKAGVRTNRPRPVKLVETVTLSTGQTVTASQIGALVGEGLVEIPRHQAVRNARAEGGWYLRSLANDTTVDNLIR